MIGINAIDGKALEGVAHLRQSIVDILTTPIGSRVMLRDYGSRLFELIDAPANAGTLADIRAATAEAISRWEPRFELTAVNIISAAPGRVVMDLIGNYLPDGQMVTLDGVVVR